MGRLSEGFHLPLPAALQMEEGSMSQGLRALLELEKEEKWILPLEPLEGAQPCLLPP